jgi:hypothetical protein
MFGTKFSAIATAMAAALFAAPATVVNAGPAYAIGGGIGPHACRNAALHYRDDPTYAPPPHCLNTRWFQELPPPGDAPPSPPPGETP